MLEVTVAKPHPLMCADLLFLENCASGLRLMSRSMRSHRCSIRFTSVESASKEEASNPVRLLRVRCESFCLALSCWNTVLGAPCNRNNRLHNLYDVAFCGQITVNVYQRCPMIKYYATPNHNAKYRIGLMLGEMGLLVAFSGSMSYPSTTVSPPQTETISIREQYPITFDDPGTMTPR
ncbi:hypothetical protein TNCV_4705581 [Trichonephila clavipes]|nr:hypothetical protein TNCV_4705581 [Trichonephila clavipes]